MADNHKIFIAFAIEDQRARDFLVGQARNNRSSFSFTDMSVKRPWDNDWKSRCETRIKGCDGMIALVSQNSRSAHGQLWEVETGKKYLPVLGVYTSVDARPANLPAQFDNIRVVGWTWDNIANWMGRL